MGSCIKAYHRQEERYCGLMLKYENSEDKELILENIEKLKSKYKVNPDVFENAKQDGEAFALYIEFTDDYDRESAEFFEDLIKSLGIKECEV